MARAGQEMSMLTGWFAANRLHPNMREYRYQEFPQHFVWKKEDKKWLPRQEGFAIGHMYFVAPMVGECFYLCILLTSVKGPTCWDDLYAFEGVLHPMFHTASFACGLLQNDDEW